MTNIAGSMRLRSHILLVLLLTVSGAARADFGSYIDHRLEGQALVITTEVGEVRLTAIDDAGFEVHYQETDVVQLPSFAIAGDAAQIRTQLTETDDYLEFSAPGLTASVHKSPIRIEYLRNGEPLLAEAAGFVRDDNGIGFRFALDADEKIIGGGERVLGMDRRGHRMPLYNRAHYAYETESDQMYYSLPAVMSSDRYVLVFDNSANGWLDIGKTTNDVLSFEAIGGRTSYLVIAGDSFPQLIRNYTDVTGRQPLPPRWAFGNFASRFGYRSERELRNVVRRFDRYNIPLDAVVIDIFWFGPDVKGHMGNLDWDRQAWPTPEDMIQDFRRDGIRTIVVTEPFILTSSTRWQSAVENEALAKSEDGGPRTFDFFFGNTGLVDVFNESARDWFWQPYSDLFKQGIAGSWGDLGEPEVHPGDALHWLSDAGLQATGDEVHNAYGHAWTKMIYERQVREYPDVRPMILMRSGFAGTQRYGVIPWTGDVSRSWGGLKPQVELSLSMGLLGLGYTHSDLGGFTKGLEDDLGTFDQELYLRWMQYGVFQPVYRPHAQEGIPPEPVFHDRETRNIVRDFVRLRYRLLPYIYTLAYENSTSGMPLMRPLFFEDESNLDLIDEKDVYFWGDAFLVKPVTDPGLSAVDVTLPDGVWFDFWDNTRYEGGTTASIPVDMETIPVLVRGGSFIPMVEPVDSTDEYSSDELTLHYYADENIRSATGQMYEDDGESRLSLGQGQFELLRFNARHDGDSLSIDLKRDGGVYEGRPEQRELEIVIHNWSAPVKTARFNGRIIRVAHSRRDNTLTATVDWDHSDATLEINPVPPQGKAVVYQAFTRLFGNTITTNKPWGTIEENGVGKFADFTPAALEGIRELGTTHIWYMGVPHHGVIRDYTAYGISLDDPDVIKGRAGSPYAVKDYYNVDPDLAVDPARRLDEFEALIGRTHDAGMKVIIDIVPNHVARNYESISRPDGVEDFGASDDTTVEWARDNNFYYVVGEDFEVPEFPPQYRPLGGEPHPLSDGEFDESPAKWTGNGARSAQPAFDDWYETVKINHGVRPDGSFAFDRLPDSARDWTIEQHADFWSDRDKPDSWLKFRDIVLYWTAKGVDGFRFDMAEMVPVEFWSFLNSSIKLANPDAFLLAEVYDPDRYRDYLQLGRMDYLYDKVGLYDALRAVVQGDAAAGTIADARAEVLDIEEHMVSFLENHDEERIASPNFAGDPARGKPAMVVSSLIGRGPTLLYFGQEVGADARGNPDFDEPMRNSLFDYQGLPALQRWANGGRYDGGQLSIEEAALREYYVRLLNLGASNPAINGEYAPIDAGNNKVFAFARWYGDDRLIVVSNFDATGSQSVKVEIPSSLIDEFQLAEGRYMLTDLLGESDPAAWRLVVDDGSAYALLEVAPLESLVLEVGDPDIVRHDDFASNFVGPRPVDVWLPRAYGENEQPYSVLYMHDGQNAFNAEWVYFTQTDWDIDTTLQRLIDEGEVVNTIVVGIWSTNDRVSEYMPHEFYELASSNYRSSANKYMTRAPDSRNYLHFIVDELKPFIDANYRTRPAMKDTFMMGSSAGAMISLYGLIEHPDVFGGAACLSTHWPSSMMPDDPAANEPILDWLRDALPPPGAHRIYFDYGTEELDGGYEPHQRAVDDVMREIGYEPGPFWQTRKFEGAGHTESAWQQRVGIPLEFLLGTGNN